MPAPPRLRIISILRLHSFCVVHIQFDIHHNQKNLRKPLSLQPHVLRLGNTQSCPTSRQLNPTLTFGSSSLAQDANFHLHPTLERQSLSGLLNAGMSCATAISVSLEILEIWLRRRLVGFDRLPLQIQTRVARNVGHRGFSSYRFSVRYVAICDVSLVVSSSLFRRWTPPCQIGFTRCPMHWIESHLPPK